MAGRTQIAAELLGCKVVDARGRRVGRVIAVIHKARGADVLVEGRRWFLRRWSRRFQQEDVTLLAPGVAMVELQRPPVAGEVAAASGGSRRAS